MHLDFQFSNRTYLLPRNVEWYIGLLPFRYKSCPEEHIAFVIVEHFQYKLVGRIFFLHFLIGLHRTMGQTLYRVPLRNNKLQIRYLLYASDVRLDIKAASEP